MSTKSLAEPASVNPMDLARLILRVTAVLFLILAALVVIRAGILSALYTWIFGAVSESTGLGLWPSRAATLGVLAVLWLLPWRLLIVPWLRGARRQVLALAALATLALAGMDYVTRDVYFSRKDGTPLKYYIRTLDGYTLASTPGTDPVWGVPYKPITKEVARDVLLSKRRGGNIQDPSLPEGRYFDPATGEALRWYAKSPDGAIDMFTLPGFHPAYGAKLEPVTAAVVAEYETQERERDRQRQEAEQDLRAREEAQRRAKEEARLRQPLKTGRYILTTSPHGAIDGFVFTFTEVDLAAEKTLVHLGIENAAAETEWELPWLPKRRLIRFGLVFPDGTEAYYTAIRAKEGSVTAWGDSVSFPSKGERGAFVMEYPALDPATQTFSLTVNDEPLFDAVNLRHAEYRSF